MARSDKGKRRAGYDMAWRRLKKQTQDAIRTLEVVQRMSRPPIEGRPRSERRREARFFAVPLDRVCPACGKVKTRSRQWVVLESGAVCLSCYRKARTA